MCLTVWGWKLRPRTWLSAFGETAGSFEALQRRRAKEADVLALVHVDNIKSSVKAESFIVRKSYTEV